METEALHIDVNVTARSQSPSFGLLSTVVINKTLKFEEFLVNENDGGSVTSLGFFPSSSSSPPPQIFVQLETFKPDYVYQVLYGRLHGDNVLSQKVSDEIVVEAQRRMSQGFKQPLFMEVLVKLTQKLFSVVPHSTTTESETTCAICLKDMLGESEDDYCQSPNCSHRFHESCLLEWLNRPRDSCPLCGQPICEEEE